MSTPAEREERKRLQDERDARAKAHAKKWEENASPEELAELKAIRMRMSQFFGDIYTDDEKVIMMRKYN